MATNIFGTFWRLVPTATCRYRSIHCTVSRRSLGYWKVHCRTRHSNEYKLSKRSVRNLKHLYLQILKEVGSTTEIPHGNRGHPLKLGNCRFIYINFISVNVSQPYNLVKCTTQVQAPYYFSVSTSKMQTFQAQKLHYKI